MTTISESMYPVRKEYKTSISASVGAGGVNKRADVVTIQELLNGNLGKIKPLKPLDVDGISGSLTRGAIHRFQEKVVRMRSPDSRVDPGGGTLKALVEGISGGGGGGADPDPQDPVVDGVFSERLRALQHHVRQVYGINLTANSDFRDAQTQNRWHIAHMIRFNSYASLRPAHNEIHQGRRVISIAHLSDASIQWGSGVNFADYLRDASNRPCRKTPDGQGWVHPPDAARTRARAQAMLAGWGIGTPRDDQGRVTGPLNSAQVAPGETGCVEPCRCGGRRSNHVAGVAADLNRTAMAEVIAQLNPSTEAEFDRLLARFGLHRPVRSEPWHVEAI
ncbi:MAG: M15 family metallopeptidase [Planctomycetota bacterium]